VDQGLKKSRKAQDLLAKYLGEDKTTSATVLEMPEDLPRLFEAVFHSDAIKGYEKKVETWSRILLCFALIGRTSCVTDYTPEFEDCQLPTEAKNYCEDGMPKFIILGMRDWKSRSPKCIRQQEVYKLRAQNESFSAIGAIFLLVS
jgi:hypothetical protein